MYTFPLDNILRGVYTRVMAMTLRLSKERDVARLVIPARVRRHLGWNKGDMIRIELHEGKIVALQKWEDWYESRRRSEGAAP